MKKRINNSIIVFLPLLIISIIILGCSGGSTSGTSSSTTDISTQAEILEPVVISEVVDPRQTSVTPIEDFSYEIVDGKVVLNQYKGNERVVHIAASYMIDDAYYVTDLSDFMIGIGNDIDSLVLDEGITEIAENIFNSCDIKNIYFPSTITNVTEYSFSYLHPSDEEKVQVYYPLTQEDWMLIYVNGPSGYSDAYNKGAEIANNLNELLGGSTDTDSDSETDNTDSGVSSRIEFHFGDANGEIVVDGSELTYTQETAEDYADAETPSYEDLMRYPDTYRKKKIVITIKITDVEADGVIFDGDIMGEYDGKEIAVIDNRVNKEPKMLEGDTVVIYGYGRGTSTIKVKEGFSTVDSYMIPEVDIRYLEIK